MNIYLISQDKINGYGTYDSAVVYAETEEEAQKVHPAAQHLETSEAAWKYSRGSWPKSWEDVDVAFIGQALGDVEVGVVLASFNAG